MSERFDRFVSQTRGPELVAAAVGYFVGFVGFDIATPSPSLTHEAIDDFERTASGLGTAVVAFGLMRVVRNLRNPSEVEF